MPPLKDGYPVISLRHCAFCQTLLENGTRRDKRFCSPACKSKAWRLWSDHLSEQSEYGLPPNPVTIATRLLARQRPGPPNLSTVEAEPEAYHLVLDWLASLKGFQLDFYELRQVAEWAAAERERRLGPGNRPPAPPARVRIPGRPEPEA